MYLILVLYLYTGSKPIKQVMDEEELAYQKELVYRAAMEFIKIKGLEDFIDYLQQVDETSYVPSGSGLDHQTYVAVLRRAINDYRKKYFKPGEDL